MLERFSRALFGSPDKGAAEERALVVPAIGHEALLAQVAAVEAVAAEIYARHDLPDQAGQYRRRGETGAWELLAGEMTPAEKWALIQSTPADSGWRFASLAGVGARSPVAEVRQASAILAACQGLRQRLAEQAPISAQDLADAIRLGAAWRRLTTPEAMADDEVEPLRFLPGESEI
ncbi:hypothetical protein FM111_03080 [Brevundimonas diminuta 3F5N]|uniref:Uncharacterized protein n=1 Tax=Brevundimonas diminuta 3F5N TaxID=1255603 RepID=A0A1R4F7Q9_BREDI|nr:hypothetical protein [Brevundimonas diminuta]SJM51924.1 hypothetical protein FM111_03080 [Brevundimonas diminuta 3F5N]